MESYVINLAGLVRLREASRMKVAVRSDTPEAHTCHFHFTSAQKHPIARCSDCDPPTYSDYRVG